MWKKRREKLEGIFMRKWMIGLCGAFSWIELVQDTNPLLIRSVAYDLTLYTRYRGVDRERKKKGRKGTYTCSTVTVTE